MKGGGQYHDTGALNTTDQLLSDACKLCTSTIHPVLCIAVMSERIVLLLSRAFSCSVQTIKLGPLMYVFLVPNFYPSTLLDSGLLLHPRLPKTPGQQNPFRPTIPSSSISVLAG